MKILVTGGAGMIGSNLVKRLVKNNHEVFVADNLWRGKLANLQDKNGEYVIDIDKQFKEVDLRNHQECITVTENMDVVYHLADIVAGINFVFANELFLWRANVLINSNVLNASISNNVSKFIYVGTACSYPKSKQLTISTKPLIEEEAYPAEPESAYGWSKLMGEYEVELAEMNDLISTSILRLHNVYGPNSELNPNKSQVIPALCRKAILYPDVDFIVWGSGKQRRAFVYVDDVVDALVKTLHKGMNEGVIQIGPSESVSIKEIAEMVVELSQKSIEVKYDSEKPEGDMDRTANWSKAKRVLGWEPKTQIREGLSYTFEWCEDQLKSSSS